MNSNMQERREERGVSVNGTPTREDRQFTRLSKGYAHASQVVPSYGEVCLGHGDPLMKAAVEHERVEATRNANMSPKNSHKKKLSQRTFDVYADKEVHLEEHGSPVAGLGINDVVHIDKDTALEIPCLPHTD
ncbi:unnamed protein product [Cylindrotheca closterium]|uniref:Uncharacterized protein n=1 Tax=Cylindrotheca closterium TaxID=2856 RepID=A0AAD2CTH8_9STRA|nr:unnamed protein product [Cylindrotheca closterium]